MLKYLNAKLAAGTTFASEKELQRYLNGLRGYLTRKGTLPRTWKSQETRILNRFRSGTLTAN